MTKVEIVIKVTRMAIKQISNKLSNKLIITLFLILIVFSCQQKDKKIIYKKYYKNGRVKEYYELNKDSIKDGVFKTFYPTGELALKGWFHNGKNVDSGFVYYKNGQVKEKGISIDFKKMGWWSYFDSLGHLVKKEQYINVKNYYSKDTVKDPYLANQEVVYKSDGTIDTLQSFFFNIKPVLYHKDSLKLKIFATSLKDLYCQDHDSCATVLKNVIIKVPCRQKPSSYVMTGKNFMDIKIKICPNDSIIFGQVIDISLTADHISKKMDSLYKWNIIRRDRYFKLNYPPAPANL